MRLMMGEDMDAHQGEKGSVTHFGKSPLWEPP